MSDHLIIYANRPLAGYTKTRLAAGIGAEAAAGVYARMLYSLLTNIEQTKWSTPFDITLSLASKTDVPFFEAAYPEWNVKSQIVGDLGKRMTTNIQDALENNAAKVILIGSDIPHLSPYQIHQAITMLDNHDIVFGPTPDGGFYLIGTKVPTRNIFNRIEWSTPSVLSTCRKNAMAQGFSVGSLDQLYDMDTEKEYMAWKQRLTGRTIEKE